MNITGSLGYDWLKKHGAPTPENDALLRTWRDRLEYELNAKLGLEADFTLGTATRFHLAAGSDDTATEIEAFARRSLDAFLNQLSQPEVFGPRREG